MVILVLGQVEALESEKRIQSARIKARKQGCDDIFDAAYQGELATGKRLFGLLTNQPSGGR